MTQIISVLTQHYALLASDRQLTVGSGPRSGQVFDDDTCKLVSLCNTCGIGYTGLGKIDQSPTHEWIARILSANCVTDPDAASRVLVEKATQAFAKVPTQLRRQTFLFAGWASFVGYPGPRPHFCLVTNCLDESGGQLTTPRDEFGRRVRALGEWEQLLWYVIGQPLQPDRRVGLERNLRRLAARTIGPREALRLLVDEIVQTSRQNPTVGSKVLAFCIPKAAVESQLRSGHLMMLAQLPNELTPAFTYFQPGYDELRQAGPTYVCGGFAATGIETESDPNRDYQSSQFRILRMPKANRPLQQTSGGQVGGRVSIEFAARG